MPGMVESVGVMITEEHPISGARSIMDRVHLSLENMTSSSGVAEILSRVALTTLLSTPHARPMAESLCTTEPQKAFPPSTLIPCSRRRVATFSCDGKPENSLPSMSMLIV